MEMFTMIQRCPDMQRLVIGYARCNSLAIQNVCERDDSIGFRWICSTYRYVLPIISRSMRTWRIMSYPNPDKKAYLRAFVRALLWNGHPKVLAAVRASRFAGMFRPWVLYNAYLVGSGHVLPESVRTCRRELKKWSELTK
jgi:hypothetical protein